jgi:lia operon protein LiaH
MGIYNRLKTIIGADLNEALDRFEDPLSMLNQYLREMEKQLAKAQQALADQLYLENKYQLLVADIEEVVAKRSRQAELALSKNEEEIAKLALQEKILQEEKRKMYQEQYDAAKQQTAALKDQINMLLEKFQEMQYKKLVLVSRAHAARSVQEGHAVLKSFGSEQTFAGFAKAEEQVRKLEAEAAASTYFNGLIYPEKTTATNSQLQEAVQKELDFLKQVTK